ncbi:MAG TPA: site-2 protease family protein [Ktedonobacterales bacterium]
MERPPEHTFDDADLAWGRPEPAAPREPARDPSWPAYIAPPGYTAPPPPPPVRGYGALPPPAPDAVSHSVPAPAPIDVMPAAHAAGTDATSGGPRAKRGAAAGWAAGSAIVAVLTKIGILLKVALPFLSAIVSFGAYALLFGWQFAAGILLLLFVHEMGHFAVLRAKGMPASLPVFIPLLGAYVAMRRQPQSVRDEAEIAIAGPLAGAFAGLVCVLLYQQTGLRIMLVLAYFDFLINLLNLLPVSPLDGGRIVAAISRWIWPIGLALLVGAFFLTHSLIIAVLVLIGLGQTIGRFGEAGRNAYYRMPWMQRAYITAAYFGLAGCLALGMYAVQHVIGVPTLGV